MKRTLSLLLALVMVLGSFTAVFAEGESIEEKAGALLFDLDVLKGVNEAGDLNLDGKLNRQDALVMLSRLVGAGEEAWGFPVGEDYPFTDVTDENYQSVTQWAYTNGITVGKGNGVFGYDEEITAQDYATYLMRALGYTVEAGEDYENVLVTALEKGILDDVNVVNGSLITRGVMAVLTLNALKAETADGEGTLAAKLGIELPEDEEVAPVELEVEEVVADNLKSFTVVFNQAVKSADVEIEDVDVETELSEDKMSLVGYYEEELDQSTAVTFVINAETEDGLKVEDLEVEKVVNDVTVPVALNAKALNPKQIEILFSEPVQFDKDLQLLENILVDGEAIIASAKMYPLTNKMSLTLYEAMSEGTKTLKVSKIKDYANLVAVAAEFDITVVKDEAAPVALSAEVINNKEIVVTFDEPLFDLGTFTVDGVEPEGWDSYKGSDTKVLITLENPLSVGAVVEVKVGYKGQTDVMGNEVKETTYITTKVEDDITLPTVEITKVEVKGGANVVTLTFSKSMSEEGEFELLDKDGKVLLTEDIGEDKAKFKTDTNNTVLVIKDILDDEDPDKYSIKLVDMKDASIRTNPLATVTLSFTSKDTKAPEVEANAKLVKAEKENKDGDYVNKITIYFSEAMDKATIQNLANYMDSNDKPLHTVSEYTKATAAANGKSVVLTYESDDQDAPENEVITLLETIKDEAGNKITESPVTVFDENDPALDLTIESQELISLNEIKVKFNNPVETVYTSLFKLLDDEEAEIKNISFKSAVIDGDEVIFTTTKDLDSDEAYNLKVVDLSLVKNKFGVKLSGVSKGDVLSVTDKVVPTLKVAKYSANAIKFTFSKEVTFDVTDFDDDLKVLKSGTLSENVVETVYATDSKGKQAGDALTGSVTGKVFVVYLDLEDVTKYKVGFPVGTGGISATGSTKPLKSTEYLDVK
ncbi:MAG: hypothetical protein M0Q14_06205 [Tissierellaceae bacterium]|nr:hypothetical protein [Tissierellaceae bacterium]